MKLALLLWLAMQTSIAHAIDEESIFARHLNPITPIGGVLYIPVYSTQSGDGWPSHMQLQSSNGDVMTGHLAWVEPNQAQGQWTSGSYRMRPIKPDDSINTLNASDAQTGPVLLVELNESTFETITVGGSVIQPNWIEQFEDFPQLNIDESPIGQPPSEWSRDALPEHNAMSMWRWSLLASSQNQTIPTLEFHSNVETLAATYSSQLWKNGFHRLAGASRGIAATCRDLLTCTAFDGENQFACWVTNQQQLNVLLGVMLEESISDEECAARCLAWSEKQKLYLYWVEELFGSDVRIAFANPTLVPVVAALSWQEVDSIPIAIEVPPLETERLSYERVEHVDPSLFGTVTKESQIQWLSIQLGSHASAQPFVPESVIAQTPGVLMPECLPPWTLDSIRESVPVRCSPNQRTTVELRKALGKWELFITCAGMSDSIAPKLPIRSASDVQGIEAVTIFLFDSPSPLCITPTHGVFQAEHGCNTFVSTMDNGWYARVELPDAWVNSETLAFSIARTHGDSQNIETSPLPCVPWDIKPTYIEIDLTQWDEIKKFPVQLPKSDT